MRVLLVDDDAMTLSAYKRTLDRHFEVDTAPTGEAALEAVHDYGPYAVVVADMNMPGISGLELLIAVRKVAPDTTPIMITGVDRQKVAADAVNEGRVFKFLAKPCRLNQLFDTVQEGVARYQHLFRERELLDQTFNGIVRMLMDVLAAAEPETFAGGQRLRERARNVGRAMKLAFTWELEIAAALLRVGLVTIPDPVRRKLRIGTPLDGPEADLVQRIPAIGAALLENIPRLALVAEFVRFQEKNYDGSGFPRDTLRGDEIPMGARILRALVDLDVAESNGSTPTMAFQGLLRQREHYDPAVLTCLERLANVPAEKSERIPVKVADLRPGMTVDLPVMAQEGVTLIAAGAKLTVILLERLRNFAELGQVQEPIYVRNRSVVPA